MASTTYIDNIEITNGSTTTSYLIEPTLFRVATTEDSGATYTTASLSGFALITGATIQIKFGTTNKAGATLKVGSTAAKAIWYNNAAITINTLKVNHIYTLVYDGSYWQIVGDIDTNTWRPVGTGASDAAAGNHTHGNITNDGKMSGSTASGTTTTSHKFLREDGTWQVPSYIANTNDAVTQTGNTENKDFSILLKNTDNTTDETAGVKYGKTTNKLVTVNPSTGKITAYGFVGNGSELTSLTADNLSGTVPFANLPTGTGASQVAVGNHTHLYAGSLTEGGGATKVSVNTVTGNSGIKGYITFVPLTTGDQPLINEDSLYIYNAMSNDVPIETYLHIGTNQTRGGISLHSNTNTNAYGNLIPPVITANTVQTWTLPNATGTIALTTSNITGTAANITDILALANLTKGDVNTALMGKGSSNDPAYVAVSPSISITAGDITNAPKINLTVLGVTGTTAQALTIASTSAYGVTKLSAAADNIDLAATAKSVYDLNTKVDGLLAATDAMIFKGTIGNGGTITALPAGHEAGWTYRVVSAGTYAGKYCEVGTLIICTADGTIANDGDWTSVETNEDGAVIGPSSSTDEYIAVFDGITGRIIKSGGTTIANASVNYATSAGKATNDSDNNAINTTYLKKSGGTMTGVLTAQSGQNNDSYSGAINMNNSNIYGVSSIYTVDAANNASDGIHFARDTTHVDTLWMSSGALLFVPNRILGTGTTYAASQKVLRGTATITDEYVFAADGTDGLTKQIQATNANTASTIVQRDASGNFSASMITADLTGSVTGNADTATTLQTTRKIWGNSFDGSADITGNLDWEDGTYRQRISITNDLTIDTPVFTFQQSTDSGSDYPALFTIKDNGNVIIGRRLTTTAPSSATTTNRIEIVPYYHDDGPWYIASTDDSTSAYLDIKYGSAEIFTLKNNGDITNATWKGTTVAVAYGGTGNTSFTQDCVIVSDGASPAQLVSRGLKVTGAINADVTVTVNETNKILNILANGSGALNISSTTGATTISTTDGALEAKSTGSGTVKLTGTTGAMTISTTTGTILMQTNGASDGNITIKTADAGTISIQSVKSSISLSAATTISSSSTTSTSLSAITTMSISGIQGTSINAGSNYTIAFKINDTEKGEFNKNGMFQLNSTVVQSTHKLLVNGDSAFNGKLAFITAVADTLSESAAISYNTTDAGLHFRIGATANAATTMKLTGTAFYHATNNTGTLGTSIYRWKELYLEAQASDNSNGIVFYNSTNLRGRIWVNSSGGMGLYGIDNLYFRPALSDTSKGMQLSTTNLYPSTNNGIDLGSATNEWKFTYSKKFIVEQHVTLEWNATDLSLDFIFA